MSKRAILDAAKMLLWERGYEAMSPRAVMDASGAGQGSLYHHFRSKKALAAAALQEIEAELCEAADAIFASGKPPLERIRTYLLQDRDGLKGCRMGRLGNETSLLNEAELQGVLANYFDHVLGRITETLKDAQAQGDLSAEIDVDSVATAMLSVVQGGFLISRATHDGQAVTRAAAGLHALLELLRPN